MSTAAEIQARMREATPVINRIRAAFDDFMARQPRPSVRIVAKAVHGKRGRRARRQAFYDRQRMARVLQRVMRHAPPIDLGAQADDLLRYGSTWLEVSEAGTRRVPPAEWRAEFWA